MLNWFYKNKTHFVKDEKFVIINAEDNIKDSMIGTLCGIVLNSNIYGRNVVIVGMAYTIEGDIKVSMRTNNPKIDLRGIIKGIANGGGHSNSCGAFMKKEDEKSFIEDLRNVLTKSL